MIMKGGKISQGCIQIHKDEDNFRRVIILHTSGKIPAQIFIFLLMHMEAWKSTGKTPWDLCLIFNNTLQRSREQVVD